jgi:3-oxoacyl-[acyl-carrier protein] reductase
MLLQDKVAVIYGAGGAVGGAVAHAFAQEGATVFLAGRTLSKVQRVADAIMDEGGFADAAQVDALDQRAVEAHLEEVFDYTGCIDISFNLIGLGELQGAPLVDMASDNFTQPLTSAVHTHFLTATAAARHMVKQKSGVILALTAHAAHKPSPEAGSFGVAGAAVEGLCRQLSFELEPHHIRVAYLRSLLAPDATGVDEVANAAVLMASDRASAIKAAVANLSCGMLVG